MTEILILVAVILGVLSGSILISEGERKAYGEESLFPAWVGAGGFAVALILLAAAAWVSM